MAQKNSNPKVKAKSPKSPKKTKSATTRLSGTEPRQDFAAEHQAAKLNITNYAKSQETNKAYEGYIKRGCEWLATFASGVADKDSAMPNSTIPKNSVDDNEVLTTHPDFLQAFNGRPNKYTPIAIHMFMAFKSFEMDKGKSTAESIHAAFKCHYKIM